MLQELDNERVVKERQRTSGDLSRLLEVEGIHLCRRFCSSYALGHCTLPVRDRVGYRWIADCTNIPSFIPSCSRQQQDALMLIKSAVGEAANCRFLVFAASVDWSLANHYHSHLQLRSEGACQIHSVTLEP